MKKLQGPSHICKDCDLPGSGQCFSSVVFIALRLRHKRRSDGGLTCSLTLPRYGELCQGMQLSHIALPARAGGWAKGSQRSLVVRCGDHLL